MNKKMIIGIVLAAIILVPASLFAEENERPAECPLVMREKAEKAEQAEKQVQARRKARALVREQQTSDQGDEENALQTRRDERRQRGMAEGPDKRREGMPEGMGGGRGMGLQANGERFDGLLEKLTEAYRSNDREEMGRLLRKMHEHRRQMRQKMQKFGPQGREPGDGEGRQYRGLQGEGPRGQGGYRGLQGEGPRGQGGFRRGEEPESHRRFGRGDGPEGHGSFDRGKGLKREGSFYEGEDFDRRYMNKHRGRGRGDGEFRERNGRPRAEERGFRCRCENCPMRFECEGCPRLKRHLRQMEQERPRHKMPYQDKNLERRERFHDNDDGFDSGHRDRVRQWMRR